MNRKLAVAMLAVGAASAWVMWPCVANGILYWDDNRYLERALEYRNLGWPALRWAFTTLYLGNYIPLAWLSHILDWQLFGANAFGHHAVSVLWHALNAGLVTWLAWAILNAARPAAPRPSDATLVAVAAGVGLIFGVHPLQVESVAWISERKNLLCATFSIGATLAYLRQRIWLATALLGGALLAKPAAVPLPAAFLALDFFPLERYRQMGWARLVREKWLMVTLSAIEAGLTVVAQQGALASWEVHGWSARTLTAARGFGFYLAKLAWPTPLSPFYPLRGDIGLGNPEHAGAVAVCVGITILAVAGRRRVPALLPAWASYLLLVGPVCGLMQVGAAATADRYAYMAMIPVLLAVASVVFIMPERLSLYALALAGFWGALLAGRARAQIPVWRDTETLWRTVLEQFPESGTANAELAAELARQERFDEAAPFAEMGYEKRPDFVDARWAMVRVWLHRAEALTRSRQYTEALPFAERSVKAAPDDAFARSALGMVLLKIGRFERAAGELEEAVRLDARLPGARYNLACAYAQVGRLPEAKKILGELAAEKPEIRALAARDPLLASVGEF